MPRGMSRFSGRSRHVPYMVYKSREVTHVTLNIDMFFACIWWLHADIPAVSRKKARIRSIWPCIRMGDCSHISRAQCEHRTAKMRIKIAGLCGTRSNGVWIPAVTSPDRLWVVISSTSPQSSSKQTSNPQRPHLLLSFLPQPYPPPQLHTQWQRKCLSRSRPSL